MPIAPRWHAASQPWRRRPISHGSSIWNRSTPPPCAGARTGKRRRRKTPAPKSPSDVLSVGDVVAVRVAHVQTQRTSSATRVQRLELALEQTPKVQGAFIAMDLKTRGVLALAGGYDPALSSFNRATQ